MLREKEEKPEHPPLPLPMISNTNTLQEKVIHTPSLLSCFVDSDDEVPKVTTQQSRPATTSILHEESSSGVDCDLSERVVFFSRHPSDESSFKPNVVVDRDIEKSDQNDRPCLSIAGNELCYTNRFHLLLSRLLQTRWRNRRSF